MSSDVFSVEVGLVVLLCQGLEGVDDVMKVHSAAEFDFRRRLADGQGADALNVDVGDVGAVLVVNSCPIEYKLTFIKC